LGAFRVRFGQPGGRVQPEGSVLDCRVQVPSAGALSSVGGRLRVLRVGSGLSQAALAERAGVDLATVKAIERDRRRRPHPHTLARLAEALGLAPAERDALLALARGEAVPSVDAGRPPTALAAAPSDRLPNLPAPLTPLIGRTEEVVAAREQIAPTTGATRLLTLVGPGGVGKTRLGLAVAAALAADFVDGVVFVDLAPLHDARLVPATISRALGVSETVGRSARKLLVEHLRAKRLLLVLDNFEHLLAAAPLVTDLLAACAELKVLVTSRTALRLRGEHRMVVAPLAVAESSQPLAVIAEAPAVQLFVQCAQAIARGFALSEGVASDVASICKRLDGLPLAIELAAAWIGLLPPATLLQRLEHRLSSLTSGSSDSPERQRTLRATLTWSHDLLEPTSQVLFRRLAVFAGGWTLESLEAVCADTVLPADAVLDGLQVLLDSSLVRRLGEARFSLLETVREYALEQLDAAGEGDEFRTRHSAYFLSLSERAEPHLTSAEQAAWLDRLDGELDNLRASLAWARDSRELELGLRLAVTLLRFWDVRHEDEGREWLDSLMRGVGDSREPRLATLHAQTLGTTSWLAYGQGDHQSAKRLAEQCLARWRQCGQVGNTPVALSTLAFVAGYEGNVPKQEALFRHSVALYRAAGDSGAAAWVLTWLATVRFSADDLDGAQALLAMALDAFQEKGDIHGIALAWHHSGNVAAARGEYERAQALLERSMSLYADVASDGGGVAYVLGALAGLAACRGEQERARTLCEESVGRFRQQGSLRGLVAMLGLQGRLAMLQGDDAAAIAAYKECLRLNGALVKVDLVFVLDWLAEVRARVAARHALHAQLVGIARLFGAAAALRDRLGAAAARTWAIPLAPPHRDAYAEQVAATRTALGDKAFLTAWKEGCIMTPDRAVLDALAQANVPG
jgi:predicted ATPase/transcriptional regulator with XRE-family HTH domain